MVRKLRFVAKQPEDLEDEPKNRNNNGHKFGTLYYVYHYIYSFGI